jgi:hypothetical protein
MRLAATCVALAAATLLAAQAEADDASQAPPPAPSAETEAAPQEPTSPALPWRQDPGVRRRPGSYLGGAIGYSQTRAWIPANDSHGDLALGPVHTYGLALRVGDAFAEWFAVGFQVQIYSGKSDTAKISAFDLLLDATFYPWQGLGLRPSVGLGFGYARGEHEWEMGGGGPGCLAVGVLYEFRVTRLFSIAPIVQVSWIAGEEFDSLFLFVGIELAKWFGTAIG